jgi:CubicO group peptidase (beta-lactamase class C family)
MGSAMGFLRVGAKGSRLLDPTDVLGPPVACQGDRVTDPIASDAPLVALPHQPAGLAWPTRDWALGDSPAGAAIDALVDEMFGATDRYETTYAVLVVHRGVIVAERYEGALPNWVGDPIPVHADTPLLSWSMAKSMLHAAVGILVGDGRLAVHAPGLVPEWTDERAAITLPDLLEMRDGLAWSEDYVEAGGSQVIEMLFGEGQHDVGAFARARAAAVPPGTRFNYSSGTSNIVSGIVADVVGRGDAYTAFLRDRLFAPIGMTSAQATLDASGLWVASSYVHATARDFARFGYLYLRDGHWDGTRVLPEGWVDTARRLRSIDPDDGRGYGRQWWVTADDHGTFWANGYEGQSILVSPGNDLVVVRIGRTDASRGADLFEWRARMVDAVADVA